MAALDRFKPILDDMRDASAAVDDAVGTSEYNARLVALALIARHFLRELDAAIAKATAEHQ